MSVVVTYEEPVLIPTGSYMAELDHIDTVESNYGPGESLRWFFKVYSDEAPDGELLITAMSSMKFTPASKAGRWAFVMMGGKRPQRGEEFNLSQLIGCQVQVHIDLVTKEDGRQYCNLKDILQLIDNTNSFWYQKQKKKEAETQTQASDVPFTDSEEE